MMSELATSPDCLIDEDDIEDVVDVGIFIMFLKYLILALTFK